MNSCSNKKVSNWNEQDFENFVSDNSTLFRLFVKHYIKDKSFGEDIVQDTLFKFWRNRKSIDTILDATAYVLTMIKHNSLNAMKKHSRLNYMDIFEYDGDKESDFFNDILEAETYSILLRTVDELPEMNRKIITMSLKGMTNDQIATELSLTIDSVKSLKWRSVNILKKKLPDKLLLSLLSLL